MPPRRPSGLSCCRWSCRICAAGYLQNPKSSAHRLQFDLVEAAARQAGVSAVLVEMPTPEEVATAFATLVQEQADAVIVPGDAFFVTQRQRIAELAIQHRLPTIFPQREYAEAGGLMSYGENLGDFFRRSAYYVDKILKGAKPAELSV